MEDPSNFNLVVGVVLEEALVVEVMESLASRKRAKSGVALNKTG